MGLLAVTARRAGIADSMAGVAKAAMGAGLLVLVASLASQAERGSMLGASAVGLADGE